MTSLRSHAIQFPCHVRALSFWRTGSKPRTVSSPIRKSLTALSAAVLLAIAACHSFHIDTTIENRTGAPVQLLEVDYPDASFGADVLASGAVFHYRFVVRGSGPLKITYTGPDRKQIHITGPTLTEPVQGQLQIVLLPAGQARFAPRFIAPR